MDGEVEREKERERVRNEWRKLCASRGCDVWALICQLLHFAATEHPDEFRRRRDSLAQTLFAPTWSDTAATAISNSNTATKTNNTAYTKAAAAAAANADPSAAPGSTNGSPEKLASAGASARGAAAAASSGVVSRAASQARRKNKDDEYNPDEPGLAAVGFARGSGIGAGPSHPHPHPHRQAVDDAYDPTEPGFSPNRRLCRQGVPDGRRPGTDSHRPGADGHRSGFEGHRVATDVDRPGREAATRERAVLATGVGKDRDVQTHTALGRGDGQESLSQDSGRVTAGGVDGSCSQTASPLRGRLGDRNGQAGGSGDCLAGGRDWQAGGSRDAGSHSKHRNGVNQSGLRRSRQQMLRASPEEQSDEREDERRGDVEVVDFGDEEEDEGRQEGKAEGTNEMVEGEMGLRHKGGEDGGGGVERQGEEEEGEEGEEEVRPEDEVEAWADEMESEERVLRVVQATKKTLGNPALGESAIMAELRMLEKLPISLDVLRMTQVGKVVKSLGKKHKSLAVQKLAHKLVREWKRVVMDCCTVAAASAAAVRKERPHPHPSTAEGAVGLSTEGEGGEEWRERADASAMDHCEEDEDDDGTLAAPPLDEKVFQLSALELSNCFTDLESMESELSGSVGSANGQLPSNGSLPHGALKAVAQPGATPPYPESSPSETSEPVGRSDALDPHHHAHHHHHRQKEQRGHVSGRQSVLSPRVVKSGWEVNEEAAVAAAAAAAAAPSTAAAGLAPVQGREGRKSGQAVGERDFQRHKASPLPPRAEGVSRRPGVPTNESVSGSGMANGMRRCTGSGQMAKQGKELTALPSKVETKMRPQAVEDRLAEAKRKLTERYNGLEEAKKARTIQVLDVGPANGPGKPKFKPKPAHPFGAAGQRFSLGQQAWR